MTAVIIVESIIAILSVIGLLWIGIFIGREFGSLEKFILYFFGKMEKQLGGYDPTAKVATIMNAGHYESLDTYTIKGKQCFAVLLPKDCNDFNWIIGQFIIIDNSGYKVLGVDRKAHSPPWHKGEAVGFMVEPV